jgi:hypothetical protein
MMNFHGHVMEVYYNTTYPRSDTQGVGQVDVSISLGCASLVDTIPSHDVWLNNRNPEMIDRVILEW